MDIRSRPSSPVPNLLVKPMQCRHCGEKLEVARRCREVKLRCTGCGREYPIHEVAADLDEETERILERYTCIIYD